MEIAHLRDPHGRDKRGGGKHRDGLRGSEGTETFYKNATYNSLLINGKTENKGTPKGRKYPTQTL